jgi:hypothetical protein
MGCSRHTVSYAIPCGPSVTAAVSMYSAEELADLPDRIVCGLLGDRFGPKRTFASGLLPNGTQEIFFAAVVGSRSTPASLG